MSDRGSFLIVEVREKREKGVGGQKEKEKEREDRG